MLLFINSLIKVINRFAWLRPVNFNYPGCQRSPAVAFTRHFAIQPVHFREPFLTTHLPCFLLAMQLLIFKRLVKYKFFEILNLHSDNYSFLVLLLELQQYKLLIYFMYILRY